MKYLIVLLFSLACFSTLIYSQEDTRGLKKKLRSQTGKRWAICIGIDNYADRNLNKLKKAANDAYGLGTLLEQQGDFKVTVFSDMTTEGAEQSFSSTFFPTKKRIEDYLSAITKFRDINPNDLVVFSFSGHGISDASGNGYLLPIDWDSSAPYGSSIPVSAITSWLDGIGVTRSLLLIDACREEMGTSRSIVSLSRLYEQKFDSAHVSAVFYATRQGGFSYEDPESNYGAFTRFLIDGLRCESDRDNDGLVTFRELSTYVEDTLGEWARKKGYLQRPYTRILGEQSGDLALSVADWSRIKKQFQEPKPVPQKPAGSVTNIAGITMVSIPGGTFQMGSNDGESNEKPVHTVTVSAFEMSATEITQGQYKAIMGSNPSHFTGDDNLPVERVSWEDAVQFCRAFSQKTGSEFRLPTEAEWEYACRAGTNTNYNTGNSESDLARAGWYSSNSGSKIHPVGQKEANAWGLYDMHGNVWEWCNDWYGTYSSGSVTNPIGAHAGSSCVRRGGSWAYSAYNCRSAYRDYDSSALRLSVIGFRVVRRP